jgi:hypothetical protein
MEKAKLFEIETSYQEQMGNTRRKIESVVNLLLDEQKWFPSEYIINLKNNIRGRFRKHSKQSWKRDWEIRFVEGAEGNE